MIFIATLNRNTTGVTSRTGITYPFGTPEFSPGFSEVCFAVRVAYCVMCCPLMSVLLRFTASDYLIDIFKLFVIKQMFGCVVTTSLIRAYLVSFNDLSV
jgi:hypothetical protein